MCSPEERFRLEGEVFPAFLVCSDPFNCLIGEAMKPFRAEPQGDVAVLSDIYLDLDDLVSYQECKNLSSLPSSFSA